MLSRFQDGNDSPLQNFHPENVEDRLQFGRLKRKSEDNIKMGLKITVWECGLDSCGSGWDPVA